MCLAVISTSKLQAQNVGINSTGASPDVSAALDVNSNSKGILIPRIALTSCLDVTTIPSPATSLLVYNTATAGTSPNQVLPGYYFWNGTKWVSFMTPSNGGGIIGEIRSMIKASDFNGWVLLDGRSVGSLTLSQQAVALSMGFTSSIPDASNAYLTQNGGSMGATVGSNSLVLTQANLPNINLTGTTSSEGLHTHSYSFDDDNTSIANSGGTNTSAIAEETKPTTTDGAHSHTVTVSSGGNNVSINKTPKTLSVNMFIYLGL